MWSTVDALTMYEVNRTLGASAALVRLLHVFSTTSTKHAHNFHFTSATSTTPMDLKKHGTIPKFVCPVGAEA